MDLLDFPIFHGNIQIPKMVVLATCTIELRMGGFFLDPPISHWQHEPVNLPATKTKVSLNHKTGLLEVYDAETGKLLVVQESPGEIFQKEYESRLVRRILPDGSLVLVEATIDPTKLLDFSFREYSSYVVDIICQKLTEGMSLKRICELDGFPSYSELCRWKRQVPAIDEQLAQSRRDRAEYLRDLAFEEALAIEEDTATSDKGRFEALMKLAGTDDREKYGNAKGTDAVVAPIQILISTGIIRENK